MSGNQPARRCTICAIDWPDNWAMYGKCCECGETTDRITNGDPLPLLEARSRKLHAEFDRYYERWCADRDSRQVADLERILAAPASNDGPPLAA